MHSQSGVPQAPLAYESLEPRSEVFIWFRTGLAT